jgi:hypothetical protein
MDCPLCGAAVGFRRGTIGLPPADAPVARRSAEKASRWAESQAVREGGTLRGYTSSEGAGGQYANYWTSGEIDTADAKIDAENEGR